MCLCFFPTLSTWHTLLTSFYVQPLMKILHQVGFCLLLALLALVAVFGITGHVLLLKCFPPSTFQMTPYPSPSTSDYSPCLLPCLSAPSVTSDMGIRQSAGPPESTTRSLFIIEVIHVVQPPSFLSVAPKSIALSPHLMRQTMVCYFISLPSQIQHLSTWTQFLTLQIVLTSWCMVAIFFLTMAWNFIETLDPSSHLSSPCSAGWFFPQNFSLNRINGYLFSLPLSSLMRTIQIVITYNFSHLPRGLLIKNPLPSSSAYSASITLHLSALTSPPQRNLSCPLWRCKIHALL